MDVTLGLSSELVQLGWCVVTVWLIRVIGREYNQRKSIELEEKRLKLEERRAGVCAPPTNPKSWHGWSDREVEDEN